MRSSLGALWRLTACRMVLTGINRLKKVQGKKKRDVAARESARAAEQRDNDVTEATGEVTVDDEGGGDLLSSKDEDVIF